MSTAAHRADPGDVTDLVTGAPASQPGGPLHDVLDVDSPALPPPIGDAGDRHPAPTTSPRAH